MIHDSSLQLTASNSSPVIIINLLSEEDKGSLCACVDGIKGISDTHIQLSIVHIVRNSMKFVPWKDYKAIVTDLKKIYQSATEDEALLTLGQLAECWDDKYPKIRKSWRAHWQNLNTLFNYATDYSAKKVVYLVMQQASKKWTMPIRNWKAALNRFMVEFEERLTDVI